MELPKSRHLASIRVTKTQLMLEKAIDAAIQDNPELTEAELMLALARTTMRHHEQLFMDETPPAKEKKLSRQELMDRQRELNEERLVEQGKDLKGE